MPSIRLVCWDEDLAPAKARLLTPACKRPGFTVDASRLNPSGLIRRLRANPPAAVVIDLDRLPSHGREVGVAIRASNATRHIPIVFAGGAAGKVERIRTELPDASFTSWNKAGPALIRALKNPPPDPVRPVAHMQRYAGSSLVKKLGIKPDMHVALLGVVPEGFEETLGDLPEGVVFDRRFTKETSLAIWFVRSRGELELAAQELETRLAGSGSVWIVHPKQSGRHRVDFNQNDVRTAGLAHGLVDYKVCAVDGDWSGLKFARRKR
jgi:hypothetical protein